MPKLDLNKELTITNNRCLQLQAQLDCTNQNYLELNNNQFWAQQIYGQEF